MNTDKLHLLAFAAHPDDSELSCSGTLYTHAQKGFKVGVADLTQGELGSRGTIETRQIEAANASKILGLHARANLGLRDGFFQNSEAEQIKLIEVLRHFQPEIVLINAPTDRHPDHGKGAIIAKDACFLSGLRKIETSYNGQIQAPWRPKRVFHYIQDKFLEPDFVVDISSSFEVKMQAIKAFETQFFNEQVDGPQTYISSASFLDVIEARAREMGRRIGCQYGEGFINTGQTIGLNSLFDQILPDLT
jgi:N-acetylglucosamine malate deacetylase 1